MKKVILSFLLMAGFAATQLSAQTATCNPDKKCCKPTCGTKDANGTAAVNAEGATKSCTSGEVKKCTQSQATSASAKVAATEPVKAAKL